MRRPASLALDKDGSSIPDSMAIIAITTNSSIRVKALVSDLINFIRMRPLKKDRVSSSYDHQYNEEFEEGKLVIFPGWLRHHVKNNKNENRQIIGFNTMPIGITKRDRFDRYFYQDFRNLPMHGDDELDYEQDKEYKY
jgi:hypothetical protein